VTQKDIAAFRESTTCPSPRAADIGDLLRQWRNHRGISQMTLALDCGISSRHLSFIETGRARPSREVALRLGDCLQLSPQLRNRLLQAAGLAPELSDSDAEAPEDIDSAVAAARKFVNASSPYPAMAIDRRWTLVARNAAASVLLQGVDETLLQGDVNLLRLWLHPRGLSSRIVNIGQWRSHLIRRFHHQVERDLGDDLRPLLDEMRGYAGSEAWLERDEAPDLTLPLSIRLDDVAAPLSFLGATSLFGNPNDVRCSQIAIASFLPSDVSTRSILTRHYGA